MIMLKKLLSLALILPNVLASNLKCDKSVGIEKGQIQDDALTDSSHYSKWQAAKEGRLNRLKQSGIGEGAWCPKKDDVAVGSAFIQVNLGNARRLGNLLTQGRNTTHDQYVKSFKVSSSADGVTYTFIQAIGKDKVFTGNTDKNSIVINSLLSASGAVLTAQYVRIYPVEFYANPCMRIELHECEDVTPTCPTGQKWSADKSACVDIDECKEGVSLCDTFSTFCVNTNGHYTCNCKLGFKNNPTSIYRCLDVNECVETNHTCQQNCHNTQGSYYCQCNAGYKLDSDGKTCVDVDECAGPNPTHKCDLSTSSCQNTDGDYDCVCKQGYERNDKRSCKDKNECRNGESKCDFDSSYCINEPGGYLCLCRKGYKRPENQTNDPFKCQDVNECAANNGFCSDGCQNKPGSFECTCPSGYQISKDDRYKCVDTNECLTGNGNCEHKCHNNNGSFTCSCRDGFKADGKYKCLDIDECSDGSNKCDSITTNCQNNQPYYQCNCKTGFRPISGNSYKCEAKVCKPLTVSSGTIASPGGCVQAGGAYAGINCTFSCQAGYEMTQGANAVVTCNENGQWSGVAPSCTKRSCPALSAPANGILYPDFCASRGNVYQENCYYKCNSSFSPTGTPYRTCQADGSWSTMQTPFSCNKVYPKPTITCPGDVTTDLSVGESSADVSALLDSPQSNVKQITVSPAKYQNSYIFPAGTTELTYTATSPNGVTSSCKTLVNVIDKEYPKVANCPNNIYKEISGDSAALSWTPPTFTDNVGISGPVISTHKPGDLFKEGSVTVVYTAKDARQNAVSCSFKVFLKKKVCQLKLPKPSGGKLQFFEFNSVHYVNVVCDAGKATFYHSPYITCSSPTFEWATVIPDCVDYADQLNDGSCPFGMVKQKSLSVYPPPKAYCVKCFKGTFYNSQTKTCDPCKIGFTSTTEGSTSCNACPLGTSTLKEGSKNCTDQCKPGSASLNGFSLPSQTCEQCRRGKYEDRSGSTACKVCPGGLTTLTIGSTSINDCGGPPSVAEFSSTPLNATEHQSVELICRGAASPSPTFKIKKVKPAPDGFGGPVKVTSIVDANNRVTGIRHTITKVTQHDAGHFICEVENKFDLAKKYYHLNVKLIIGESRRRR